MQYKPGKEMPIADALSRVSTLKSAIRKIIDVNILFFTLFKATRLIDTPQNQCTEAVENDYYGRMARK